ncbi:hypothetical protein E2C01_056244 [Portunus trituberculatus]|uniref:Uncharacterized protein n=1 Tax=Portunus trituberculatus TaxID=210409 RepID=A0A5B7GPU2_PORTR|nr:hypothetical protein [Portunus trituberculatus]
MFVDVSPPPTSLRLRHHNTAPQPASHRLLNRISWLAQESASIYHTNALSVHPPLPRLSPLTPLTYHLFPLLLPPPPALPLLPALQKGRQAEGKYRFPEIVKRIQISTFLGVCL